MIVEREPPVPPQFHRKMCNATLHTLPPPPPGRVGWPWTVGTPALSAARADGAPWPRVTVVTPSFNQARFLEETIRSVLLQGYPHLEYIVLDGGSRDESVAVIRRYEPWLSYWTSGKDGGQSDAINRGFRRATGEWVGRQNSDDYYGPGALGRLVEAARVHPTASVIYGGVELCDGESKVTGSYPTSDFDPEAMLPRANMFNQSMFLHRRIFEAGHLPDESRWALFDAFTADLKRTVGRSGLGANLALRRLVRVIGTGNIDRVRRVKHLVIKPHEA